MGTRELAAALKISPGLVSRLTRRGMPMSSTEAANAWRAIHAPPRQRPSAQPPIPALFNKPPQCNAGPSLQDDDLDLSGLDENIPWIDFAGDEIADIELDDEILSTPTRRDDEPPAGLFALSRNRFLHQFTRQRQRIKTSGDPSKNSSDQKMRGRFSTTCQTPATPPTPLSAATSCLAKSCRQSLATHPPSLSPFPPWG